MGIGMGVRDGEGEMRRRKGGGVWFDVMLRGR